MTRALICLLLAARAAGAAAPWQRMVSPHFELYTDAGEQQGRAMLGRLETIHGVFRESIGAARREWPPVRVILYGSARDYAAVRPSEETKGFYQSAPERDYIVLHDFGPETQRAVRHEYVHLAMNHGSSPLPRWLEEGTAELYSTLETREDRAVVGLPVAGHLRALARLPWLSAAAMAAGTPEHTPGAAGMFYAQSWALVHMLNFAPPYRRQMPRFAALLERATPPSLAFEEAFGRTLDQALGDLRAYLGGGRLPAGEVVAPGETRHPVDVEPVAATAAALVQVELMLAVRRIEAAGRLLARLTADAGNSPDVLAAAALGALQRRDHDEARRLFRRAIDAGVRSALPYFEYAMLLRDAGAPPVEVRKYLAEAAGRNPDLAEAQFLLGLDEQQEGRHREAIAYFDRAIAVLPRQSSFWHAKAISHHRIGQTDPARRAAARAAAAATSPQQLEMARAALDLVSKAEPSPAPAVAREKVVVPDSWKPKAGNRVVEGTLEHIDCLGAAARFQIRAEGKPVRLWVDKPGEVLLHAASSLTFVFACGPQRPRVVAVEYVGKPDAARQTEGEITAIHFP